MIKTSQHSVVWSGNRLKNSGNLVYFYDYFDYIDFVYSAKELKVVTNKLNSAGVEDFDKIIYSQLLEDKNYLTDLLGTKYLRENNLKAALTSFESIGQVYWEENYNAWEHRWRKSSDLCLLFRSLLGGLVKLGVERIIQ